MQAQTGRDDVSTTQVHDLARDTIRDMTDQCARLAATFGPSHDVTTAAYASLARVLARLFAGGFGPYAYVTRDGVLSLYVQEGSTTDPSSRAAFVFGVIFHADSRFHGAELARPDSAFTSPDGVMVRGCLQHVAGVKAGESECIAQTNPVNVAPCVVDVVPMPGTWATHS